MAAYSLTILESEVSGDTSYINNITDSAALEVVYPGGATSVEFTFNRNISKQTKLRVLTANFGDGYSQRVGDGINIKEQAFSVQFSNRLSEEVRVIEAFLDNKSANSFNIVINGETIKVSSEGYNTTYTRENYHSITTNFKRVYEP